MKARTAIQYALPSVVCVDVVDDRFWIDWLTTEGFVEPAEPGLYVFTAVGLAQVETMRANRKRK